MLPPHLPFTWECCLHPCPLTGNVASTPALYLGMLPPPLPFTSKCCLHPCPSPGNVASPLPFAWKCCLHPCILLGNSVSATNVDDQFHIGYERIFPVCLRWFDWLVCVLLWLAACSCCFVPSLRLAIVYFICVSLWLALDTLLSSDWLLFVSSVSYCNWLWLAIV